MFLKFVLSSILVLQVCTLAATAEEVSRMHGVPRDAFELVDKEPGWTTFGPAIIDCCKSMEFADTSQRDARVYQATAQDKNFEAVKDWLRRKVLPRLNMHPKINVSSMLGAVHWPYGICLYPTENLPRRWKMDDSAESEKARTEEEKNFLLIVDLSPEAMGCNDSEFLENLKELQSLMKLRPPRNGATPAE
jgi:hypothetical protein